MSRESTIKAVAGGLQAKSLDLTQYAKARAASRERQTMKLRSDEAAGALAFAGDELASALLRLKYADQHSKMFFDRAINLLMHRHEGLAAKRGMVVYAVATVALFEWMRDACPACRPLHPATSQPRPCLECGQRMQEMERLVDGVKAVVKVVVGQPTPGCSKCRGLGRIFPRQASVRRGGAFRCVKCRSRGRVDFPTKQRFRLVNDLLRDMRLPGGRRVALLTLDVFRSYWTARYHGFLDVLRAVDTGIADGIDLTYRKVENRAHRVGVRE